jgi:hypothetical protein
MTVELAVGMQTYEPGLPLLPACPDWPSVADSNEFTVPFVGAIKLFNTGIERKGWNSGVEPT